MGNQAFELIDAAAVHAQQADAHQVRTLTDVVLTRLIPRMPLQHSLRERLFLTERAFRQNKQLPITEFELETAMNFVLREFDAPMWAQTTAEQLHVVRGLLRGELPNFIGALSTSSGVGHDMSPAETAFLVLLLGKAMLEVPDANKGPQEWTRIIQAEARTSRQSQLIVRTASEAERKLVTDLCREDTAATKASHQLCDRLHFLAP